MRRHAILATLFATLLLAGCGESSLPTPTGKASLRAINAISRAPEMSFKIEERTFGTAGFRQVTSTSTIDDLSYNFNFEVFYRGDLELTRIASTFVDVAANIDYIFVVTGTLDDAAVAVWETTSRGFDGSESIFEVRFAHTADSLGTVDYYFAAPGVPPALGEAAGTLAFGDVTDAVDLDVGDYALTITAAGDPDQVLYQSEDTAFGAGGQFIVTSFDAGATTDAPYIARAIVTGFGSSGGTTILPDRNYPPSTVFINGALDLGTVDIYDDETLTSQIVSGQAFKDVATEIDLVAGDNPVYYTPTTMLSPVVIEDVVPAPSGVRARSVAYGTVDNYRVQTYVPNRQPIDTAAKLHLFNAAVNFDFLDVYIVDVEGSIVDFVPRASAFQTGTAAETIQIREGSFDLYITEFRETEVLAGPIRLDVEIGDVFEGIIFDTVDPAVLELNFLED